MWAGLRRPLDPVPAVVALLGISGAAARQLVSVALATSDEAEALLDAVPHVVRSLAVSTLVTAMRCVGEVRGAVLWSETMAARSASPGAGEVFVCASTAKAFDTAENQVLVQALLRVRNAADAADGGGAFASDDPEVRRARHNGARATRFLDHRTLLGVGRTKIDGRQLRRARAGTRRRTYEPAVAMIERAAEAVSVEHLLPLCDARTAAQHDVLAALARGLALPSWMAKDEEVVAGPVRYAHPRGRHGESGRHGIMVGQLLIDVPGRRDGDADVDVIVESPGDIAAAVARARREMS